MSKHSLNGLKRWSCTENNLPDTASIKYIHVYDFDNTLFASPLPNRQLWQGSSIGLLQSQESLISGGWWHDVNVLKATGQGLDVEEPKAWSGWWNEQVVKLVELSMKQNDALNVLLTGRNERGFADLIERMVKSKRLQFDMIVLRPEIGPSGVAFTTTMKFKQAFLTDLIYTYSSATEVRLYEDRVKHVGQFREFFDKLKATILSTPDAQHRSLNAEVVEVTEQATCLDPLTEIAEVQRMINAHNTAYGAGTLRKPAKPWEIKRTVFYTGYLLKPEDTRRLLAIAKIPSEHPSTGIEGDYRTLANTVLITPRPCPPFILEKIGGLGRKFRWRAVALGSFDNKVFAARVEPVSSTDRYHCENPVPMVVLALKGNGKPVEANRIQQWTPLAESEVFEFETEVGEKVVLRIEEERAPAPAKNGGYKRSRPMEEDFPALEASNQSSRQGQRRDGPRDMQTENRKPSGNARGRGGQKFDRGGSRGGRGGGPVGPGRNGSMRGRGGSEGRQGRGRGGHGAYRSLDDEIGRSGARDHAVGIDGTDERGLAY